jgi:hypothetical protein
MSQSHGSSLWQEPAGSGGAPTPVAVSFVKSGAKWIVSTTGAAQGRLLDVLGRGKYLLIDITTEYPLTTVTGSKVTPTAGGTAAAVMATTSAKYYAAVIGAAAQTARYFKDATRGKLRLVPNAAAETLLVLIRGKVRSY